MHRRALLALAASSLASLTYYPALADEYRVTGPVVHENLAIYLVHGKSARGPCATHARGGAREGRREGARDRECERVADREPRRGRGVRAIRRHREGRAAGSRADRQPAAAAEVRPHPDRVVLRRAGPLVCARQGRREDVRDGVRRGAVARGEDRHEGAGRRERRCRSSRCPAVPSRRRTTARAYRRRRYRHAAAGGLAQGAQGAGRALRQPRRSGQCGGLADQPAARAGKREAEGRSGRLSQCAESAPARRTTTSSAMCSP